jgi:hypothetical protein
MTSLLRKPDTRARLGAAARHAVETRYSLDVFRRTLNGLYDALP